MKKFLICFLVLISVLCVIVSAKIAISEHKDFTYILSDNNGYVDLSNKNSYGEEDDVFLPQNVPSYLFALLDLDGEDSYLINENGEVQFNSLEISEGFTEIEFLHYDVHVNYSVIFDELVIPSTMKKINQDILRNVGKINVHENNKHYASYNGALYSKDMTTLISLPKLHPDKQFNIPEGVTKLEERFAYKAKNLESVVIPEGVTKIPYGSFDEAKKLSSVKLPSTLKNIAPYSFTNTSLTEIHIPDGIEIIHEWTFAGSPLERIYIPKSVTKINAAAFSTKNIKFVYYGGTAEDWEKNRN